MEPCNILDELDAKKAAGEELKEEEVAAEAAAHKKLQAVNKTKGRLGRAGRGSLSTAWLQGRVFDMGEPP